MDLNTKQSTALDGTEFLPGYVGLNNIKVTDYLNAALQVHYLILLNFNFNSPHHQRLWFIFHFLETSSFKKQTIEQVTYLSFIDLENSFERFTIQRTLKLMWILTSCCKLFLWPVRRSFTSESQETPWNSFNGFSTTSIEPLAVQRNQIAVRVCAQFTSLTQKNNNNRHCVQVIPGATGSGDNKR